VCGCGRHFFAARHLLHRSRAASVHAGKWKLNPDSCSLRGTTRRLFKINSVSVRMKTAPISNIHDVAGSPNRIPHASRRVRMNSALVTGYGAARLIGPFISSCSIIQKMARMKSWSCIQETYWLPFEFIEICRRDPVFRVLWASHHMHVVAEKIVRLHAKSRHISHWRIVVFCIPISRDLRCVCLVQHRIEDRLIRQSWWKCTISCRRDEVEFALANWPIQYRSFRHAWFSLQLY
jgi:hypothetical protein